MREIPMALSASSSSSQQNANTSSNSNENKQQGQSTLLNEISTLRSRLRDLNDDSPMNRPRSHSALTDGGRREPPQQYAGESMLVNQLRKDLSKMEQEKAEMELTLMNQMSNLAFENQTTIDSLHSRLTQSEKLVESLQQQPQSSQKPASSNHLELQRLRQSLKDERGTRKALEEERDVKHQEFERIKEERDACEQEKVTMKTELQKVQQQKSTLEVSSSKLSKDRDEATKKIQSLQSQLDTATKDKEEAVQAQKAQHKSALADAERSHQGQMQDMKQSYQIRCSKLEKEISQKFDSNQSGTSAQHSKIAELETENENLVHTVAELQGALDQEQAINQDLERGLEEQTENSNFFWNSLEESKKRCSMLEQELSERFESSHDQADLKKENEALSKQITAMQEQCAAEQEKSSKLLSTLDSERTTNSKLRLSLRQHQQRYEELNGNLHKKQSGMGLVNGKVMALDKDRKNLTTQVSQLRDQLSKEQSKTKELEGSLAKHKKAIEENLQNTADRRQTDVAALENAQLELQSVLNSYQSDMARLERKVQVSEQQLTERNRQNQRLEVEINEERRIRKSLTAQLAQAKASQQGGDTPNKNTSVALSQATEIEVQRLRKENTKLNDELKVLSRQSGQVDAAEVEFLRKQNRMLGERANGLHAEQVKELETLREKTKALNDEMVELRAKKGSSSSKPSSVFLQNDLKGELERLRKDNVALSNDLKSVKQQLASSQDQASHQNLSKPADSGAQPPPSPSRRMSRSSSPRPPPSPIPRTKIEPPPTGMQTPPLSPPLMRNNKKPSHPKSPRTPVRGIVESFERRISRSNSCSSLTLAAAAVAAAEAAPAQVQSEAPKGQAQHISSHSSPNQAQGEQSSELDNIRRDLHEQRSSVQDLQGRLQTESELVQNLRYELSLLEASDTKRKQLERTLQYREQDIARLGVKTDELQKTALEVGDLREALEQYRVTVTDLQTQLHAETAAANKLREDLSKAEQTEAKRLALGRALQESEAEVQRLESKVKELEDVALELGSTRQVMKQEKTTSQHLQNQLKAESDRVASLRKQLTTTEEKMDKETTTAQQLQNDLIMRSERAATLQAELAQMEKQFEQEKATVEDLQHSLCAEKELAAAQRSAMEESEAMRAEGKKALVECEEEIQRLSNSLTAESQRVAELRNELSQLKEAETKGVHQVRESEAEVQRLRSRVGELEVLLASSSSSQATEAAELDKLRCELAQADAVRKGFEAKLFEERTEIEKLKVETAGLHEKLEVNKIEAQQLRDDVSSCRASNEKMAQTKREDEDLIERLQTELGAARMGLERSLDEMERMKSNGEGATQQNAAASQRDQAEIQRLKTDLVVAKQALDINVEEMEKLQKCVKDADASRIITVRQSLSSQQEGHQEVEMLKSELAKEKKGHDEEVNRLRSQVAALQHELGDAMTHVEGLNAMISKLQSAHDSELQHAQKSEKRANKSIGAEVNTLQVELTKNQMSKADMEMDYMNRIHDLENKIDVMQIELDQEARGKESEVSQLILKLTRKEEEVRQLEKERLQICSSMNNLSSSRKDEFDELNEEVMNLTAQTAAQTREIQILKMKLEEHDFRGSEFQRLNERVEELEEELRRAPPPRRSDTMSPSDIEIIKRENQLLRESVRDVTLERRNVQDKLDAMLAEKSSSRSTQVLRERNAALKKEVERLTKRLKKMENNMTRFAI